MYYVLCIFVANIFELREDDGGELREEDGGELREDDGGELREDDSFELREEDGGWGGMVLVMTPATIVQAINPLTFQSSREQQINEPLAYTSLRSVSGNEWDIDLSVAFYPCKN